MENRHITNVIINDLFINQAISVCVHWCHKSELQKRHKLAKQDNWIESKPRENLLNASNTRNYQL